MTFATAIRATGLVLLGALGLAACAEDIGPNAASPYAVGSAARVDEGVVVREAALGNAKTRGGYVYTVRLAEGERTIEVAQAGPGPIAPGSRVYVSYGPDHARVQPIGGYIPGPPPPA